MPTDNERREVAARLRSLRMTAPGVTSLGHGYLWSLLWAVSGEELGESNRCDWFERMCSHLADLIEPHRGSGGRTILCAHCENASWCGCEPEDEESGCDFEPSVTEGEPPYNLYSLYEAVLKRHPRDECAIEDDEVEGLVDALLDICNAPGHDVIQRPQPSCDRDALLALARQMETIGSITAVGTVEMKPESFLAIARRIREALEVCDCE